MANGIIFHSACEQKMVRKIFHSKYLSKSTILGIFFCLFYKLKNVFIYHINKRRRFTILSHGRNVKSVWNERSMPESWPLLMAELHESSIPHLRMVAGRIGKIQKQSCLTGSPRFVTRGMCMCIYLGGEKIIFTASKT